MVAIAVTSYLVFSRPVHSGVSLPHFDKVMHFSAFFALALLMQIASGIKQRWQILLLALYALLIEAVQYHLTYRSAELLDFAADVGGALLFYALLRALKLCQPELRS